MFTVGEFSRIAQVSKRLLRYYDEIGLLKPIHTDRFTGYRYYSAEQLSHLNRILALRDLGLSLDQIQEMLRENVTIDEIRNSSILWRVSSGDCRLSLFKRESHASPSQRKKSTTRGEH